jgi:lysylphosphatidylglycerol synthetase-like protein (DUF2156 family)
MEQKTKLALRLELIWWIFTAVLAAVVVFPIVKEVTYYPFLWLNVAFVATFVTLSRYIFLLRHTFLATKQLLKIGLFFLCIPIIFALINGMNYFRGYVDDNDLDKTLPGISQNKIDMVYNFMRNEMMFFGVASIIACMIFAGRMLLSVWRTRNRGTV